MVGGGRCDDIDEDGDISDGGSQSGCGEKLIFN